MPKLKANQAKVSALADLTWQGLQALLGKRKRKRPPLYLFLSKESKGSLSKRDEAEKDFVHFQQQRGGGATLKSPPLAYVSELEQTVEETAHLFALVYKDDKLPEVSSIEEELSTTILHESFGRMVHCLFLGLPKERTKKGSTKIEEPEDLWRVGHQEGYRYGEKLAELYFKEKLELAKLRRLFDRRWTGPKSSQSALRALESLAKSRA
jgi:hypothetical protein